MDNNTCNEASGSELLDKKYRDVFDQETRGLVRRRQSGSGCTIDDLEAILKNLYIMDGADQEGRGSLQDTVMYATIAAYEEFISAWKAETTDT